MGELGIAEVDIPPSGRQASARQLSRNHSAGAAQQPATLGLEHWHAILRLCYLDGYEPVVIVMARGDLNPW